MAVEIGKIYEGKVTGITKFGAFVEVENRISGMVHISEVSNSFVNDINDVLKVGDQVKVKVIKVTDDGKISMSIKQTEARPRAKSFGKSADGRAPRAAQQGGRGVKSQSRPQKPSPKPDFNKDVVYSDGFVQKASGDANFEDMLSKFKASSEERMSDLKRAGDNRRSRSRKK